MLPLQPVGENLSLPPLRFWWLAAIPGAPQPVGAPPQSLPLSSHGIPPWCVCGWSTPFYKNTNHTGSKACPTPVWPHHYLTNDICSRSTSKSGDILSYWRWGFQHMNLGATTPPLTIFRLQYVIVTFMSTKVLLLCLRICGSSFPGETRAAGVRGRLCCCCGCDRSQPLEKGLVCESQTLWPRDELSYFLLPSCSLLRLLGSHLQESM